MMYRRHKHIIYMFGYKFIKLVKPWTSSQRQHILGWDKSQFPCPEKKWRPIFDMAQDLQLFAKLLGRMLSFRRIPRTQCVRFSAKTTKEKKLRSFRVCQLVNGGFIARRQGLDSCFYRGKWTLYYISIYILSFVSFWALRGALRAKCLIKFLNELSFITKMYFLNLVC